VVCDIMIRYCRPIYLNKSEFCASRSMMAAVTKVCSIAFWFVYSFNCSNLIFFNYNTF
jgi:hypothetical protein